MSFRSLKNVLQSNRKATHIVAFSNDKFVYWAQFLSDINTLRIELAGQDKLDCAICCEDSYYFCVALFAAFFANKKVILPGNHQPEMLKELSVYFDLIVHDGLVESDINKHQVLLPLPSVNKQTFCFQELALSEIDLTLFTSGSSGSPKAINKSALMLDTEIFELEQLWGHLIADTNIVSTVSHQHIYGLLFRALWPICAGRAFQRNGLTYPEQVVSNADSNKVLISSPALLKRLQLDKKSAPYRAVFCSGGPLSLEAAQQSNLLFKQYPFEVFGSTETGGIGYRQQFESTSPWYFFSGISAQIGKEDCLNISSPWIDPSSWYQTSDQCELLENNQFILKGRVDRIVKIEEKRVSLVEVEQRLNQLEWIEESVVLLHDDLHRVSLATVIKLTAEGEKLMLELGKGKFWIKLRQALRLWLEPVGIPRYFRVVKEIPVNTQGKRLHSEILELFSHGNGIKNVAT